jgi:hypothetical protein
MRLMLVNYNAVPCMQNTLISLHINEKGAFQNINDLYVIVPMGRDITDCVFVLQKINIRSRNGHNSLIFGFLCHDLSLPFCCSGSIIFAGGKAIISNRKLSEIQSQYHTIFGQ